jgi:hypothetical protein
MEGYYSQRAAENGEKSRLEMHEFSEKRVVNFAQDGLQMAEDLTTDFADGVAPGD